MNMHPPRVRVGILCETPNKEKLPFALRKGGEGSGPGRVVSTSEIQTFAVDCFEAMVMVVAV